MRRSLHCSSFVLQCSIGLLFFCALAPFARAQLPPPPPPDTAPHLAAPQQTPPPADPAKQHFLRGLDFFNDNNFAQAIIEFRASYAARAVPQVLYNIARAHEGLGEYLEAVETMEHFLRDAVTANPPLTADKLTEANALLADWRPRLAHLKVTSNVPTAHILVDGKELPPGSDDDGVRVRRGPHLIEVSATGFLPSRQSVDVATGQTQHIDVRLRSAMGKLHVDAEPPVATIWVDDENRGGSPLDLELASGRHTLEVKCVGFETHVESFSLEAGESQDHQVTLAKPAVVDEGHWYKKWYFWTTVALVIGGGVAAVLVATQQPQPYVGSLTPGLVKVGD